MFAATESVAAKLFGIKFSAAAALHNNPEPLFVTTRIEDVIGPQTVIKVSQLQISDLLS